MHLYIIHTSAMRENSEMSHINFLKREKTHVRKNHSILTTARNQSFSFTSPKIDITHNQHTLSDTANNNKRHIRRQIYLTPRLTKILK